MILFPKTNSSNLNKVLINQFQICKKGIRYDELCPTVKTLSDYSKFIFIPYITRHLQSVSRVDIILLYTPDSLKSFVRQCRGDGAPL